MITHVITHVSVPTFEEAVNLCLSIGMKFIIDLKDDDETV